MAINLTTTFTALGHLAYALKRVHTFVQGNLATDVTAAVTGLGTANADIAGPLESGLVGYQSTAAIGTALRTAAQQYLLRTVNADTPLADKNSLPLALAELIRQMKSQSYKVSACTVSAAATARSGNTGNGNVALTTKRGDGLTQDNLFVETGLLNCTGDAQNGSATAGAEPFQYRGDYAPVSDLGFDWPGFSGATAGLTTVNATGTAPNLLANSNFETFTVANTPDDWTLATGTTAGTNIFSDGGTFYTGAKSVKFLGNGSTQPAIRQPLTSLKPNRVYAVNLWITPSGSLASTGTTSVRLVDGSNAVINDDAGNANGFNIDLTTIGTGVWTPFAGVLVTPKVLPVTVKFQLEASRGVNLLNTEAVYIDQLAMAEATFLYPGGPAIAAFAGATPFMTGDGFDIAMANNQNSATFGATWQRVFDRFFGMRALQLLLPTTGTTLLNDSLIA